MNGDWFKCSDAETLATFSYVLHSWDFLDVYYLLLENFNYPLITESSNVATYSAWKVSKYGVISGVIISIINQNTGKYGPEITPYLDTFHAVYFQQDI